MNAYLTLEVMRIKDMITQGEFSGLRKTGMQNVILRCVLLPFSLLFSVYTPFHEEGNISKAQKAGEAIANAFIVIGVVLVLTIVLVLLYKFRCYCVSNFYTSVTGGRNCKC